MTSIRLPALLTIAYLNGIGLFLAQGSQAEKEAAHPGPAHSCLLAPPATALAPAEAAPHTR